MTSSLWVSLETLQLTTPKRHHSPLRFSAILALAICVISPFPGSAATPKAGASSCQAGTSIVFHASHEVFDGVTIAVDGERIEQRLSSHGTDYGIVVGADARKAWRIDENGVESVGSDAARRDLMTLRAVLCSSVQSSGLVPGGWSVIVHRGPSTGMIDRFLYEEGGSLQTIRVERYGHLADGSAIPVAWRVDNDAEFVVSKAELVDQPVVAERAVWKVTPVHVRPGVFDFKEIDGGFALDATIDGQPATCTIDTGSNVFAISSDLAALLDARESAETRIYQIGGYANLRSGRLKSLIIAGTTFSDPVVHVDRRLPPRTISCGNDFLSKLRLRLNFELHQATVSEAGGFACAGGCVPIDQSGVANGIATIGSRALPVLFDSGYVGSVRMPPSLLPTIQYSMTGDTAGYCTVKLLAAQVSFGGAESEAKICPAFESARFPVAIGAEAFAAYKAVVIDYPDHLLQFVK